MINKYYLLTLLCAANMAFADAAPADPCAGFLSVLNRPTTADSVCVVKPWHVVGEGGYQRQDLYPGSATGASYPTLQLRLGLPAGNEFTVLPPNYIDQSDAAGFGATVLGLKHQFSPFGKFTYGVEGIFTLPSGSDDFGSDGLGFAANALGSYAIADNVSLSYMVGVSTLTEPTNAGGGRYTTFNPDVVLAWQPIGTLQLYAEAYAQTKTSPSTSDGYNMDAGIQYLLTDYIEVDIEYGHRLGGQLGGFSHYVGAGAGIAF